MCVHLSLSLLYTNTYVYIYIYIYVLEHTHTTSQYSRLNGYLAQWVPTFVIAGSFRMCLNCEVLKGMFAWRTRCPLS